MNSKAVPALILTIALSILLLFGLAHSLVATPWKDTPASRLVSIPSGRAGSAVAAQLEEEGIIRSALLFRAYLRLHGLGSSLRSGEYLFDRASSLSDVVRKLVDGDVFYRRLTIPEGLDRWETVVRLAEAGFGDPVRLQSLVDQPDLVRDLDPEAGDLEGYLFPETYSWTASMTEPEILKNMVDSFRKHWTPARAETAKRLGMTLREVVTLASLIEKETGHPEERTLVSAVFHNRLKRGMKLECDPTVIYAVKRIKPYDGVINRSDLELESPYNTYRTPGLPPGPIANPGIASLDAALRPAPVDYLFFVARNDGTHVFSTSYREHSRAVQEFQR